MTYHYDWRWRLDATPAALWPYVSNTNHFNHDAGVPHIARIAGGPNGRQRLQLRRFGLLIDWIEEPFQWVRPQRFEVQRVYQSGPMARMRVQVDLAPAGSATDLRYQVWAEPRNLAGRAAIPFQIGLISERRFRRVFEDYARQARAQPSTLHEGSSLDVGLSERPAVLSSGASARIAAIRARLLAEEIQPALVDRLIGLIEFGQELALVRVRPYLLADAWSAGRREVVELALYATRAGLLDLQWDLMCPMCRGAKQTVDSLRTLPRSAHCDACNIDFSANFEEAVELSFRPTPAIRHIEVHPFCIGGPQVTPHIMVQQLIAAGASVMVSPQLERGRYRVRAAQHASAQVIAVGEGAPSSIELVLEEPGWRTTEPRISESAQVELVNRTTDEQLIMIERLAWNDQALSAADVTSMQRFRDLFATEALRPGESISVGSLTVLFTDLRDSTRLYRTVGDAAAFGRVLDHFEILRQAVDPEQGAVVKTIGDAVMAVFRSPANAIRAILRAQEMLAHGPEGVQPPFLKAGAHFGPCIGVTLNERLDYFGSTVNVAARIGAESRGGEIVVSAAIRYDPEVEQMLVSGLIVAEPFEARLRGFEDAPFALWRISGSHRRYGQC